MDVRDRDFVVLDFETTGSVEGHPDEPWQIGMVRIRGGRIDHANPFSSLLRVGPRPFNAHAPGRHATLRDQLSIAPPLVDLWPDLKDWWLGAPLVAHNAGTERKIVRQAAPIHRPGPWIDTLKLARVAYPNLSSYALEDLLVAFDLIEGVRQMCRDRGPHDAVFDAVGCASLLLFLLELEGWSEAGLEALASAHPAAYYRRLHSKG